jgi:putative FmdB family regulatory protein
MRYVYRCDTDGAFELNVPIKERKDAAACPKCGKEARRQLALPNVIYKSGGFYSTEKRLDPSEDG